MKEIFLGFQLTQVQRSELRATGLHIKELRVLDVSKDSGSLFMVRDEDKGIDRVSYSVRRLLSRCNCNYCIFARNHPVYLLESDYARD